MLTSADLPDIALSDLAHVGPGVVGACYRARWQDRHTVAIDVVHGVRPDAETAVRFETEAAAVQALSHPYVSPLLAGGTTAPGEGYHLTQHGPAGSLAARLAADGPLPLPEVLAILLQAAAGLAALHEAGVLHRAITPRAIRMSGYDEPRLTGAGLALVLDDVRGPNPTDVGWPGPHTAPEVRGGQQPTIASDVHALGATAIELLTGRPPEPGLAPVPEEMGIPRAAAELLGRLLAEDPDQRPASAAHVVAAVAGTEARLGLPGTKVRAPHRSATTTPQPPPTRQPSTTPAHQPTGPVRAGWVATRDGLLHAVTARLQFFADAPPDVRLHHPSHHPTPGQGGPTTAPAALAVQVRDARPMVEDLGLPPGVEVHHADGGRQRLRPGSPHPLRHGDVLVTGGLQLRYLDAAWTPLATPPPPDHPLLQLAARAGLYRMPWISALREAAGRCPAPAWQLAVGTPAPADPAGIPWRFVADGAVAQDLPPDGVHVVTAHDEGVAAPLASAHVHRWSALRSLTVRTWGPGHVLAAIGLDRGQELVWAPLGGASGSPREFLARLVPWWRGAAFRPWADARAAHDAELLRRLGRPPRTGELSDAEHDALVAELAARGPLLGGDSSTFT